MEEYDRRLCDEQIELHDELNEKLRDRAGRMAYIIGMVVTSVAILAFGWMGALRGAVPAKAVMIYLAAYLVFQYVLGVLIYKRLSKGFHV